MSARIKVSRAGIELIKAFEGLRRRAARLPDGRWTIGYGHTLSAREGAEVTEADAEALLIFDVLPIADAVEKAVTTPLTQNQFDAVVAFAFNVGLEAFRGSAVLAYLNDDRPTEAALAMEAWRDVRLDGRAAPLDPLIRRRAAEKALFLTPPGGPYAVPSALLRPEADVRVEASVPHRGLADVEVAFDGPVAGVRVLRLPDPEPEPEPVPILIPEPLPPPEPVDDARDAPQEAPEPIVELEPEAQPPSEPGPELEAEPRQAPPVAAAVEPQTAPAPAPAAEPFDIAASLDGSRPEPSEAPQAGPAPLPQAEPKAADRSPRAAPEAASLRARLYTPYPNMMSGPLPIGRPAPRPAAPPTAVNPAPAPAPAPTPAPERVPAPARVPAAADPLVGPPPVVEVKRPGPAIPPAQVVARADDEVLPDPFTIEKATPAELTVSQPLTLPPRPEQPQAFDSASGRSTSAPLGEPVPTGPAPFAEPLILTPPPERDARTGFFGALRDPEPATAPDEPSLFEVDAARVIRREVIADPEPADEEAGAGVWWLMAGVGVVAWAGALAAFLRRGDYVGQNGLLNPAALAWLLAILGAACVMTATYFLLKRVGGVKG